MSLMSNRSSSFNIEILLAWITGQVIGVILCYKTQDYVFSLMRLPTFGNVSIVYLLLSSVLPYLFLYIAAFFNKRILYISLVLFKAFIFTYSTVCVGIAFFEVGWLVRLLYFFTDSVCTPLFFYLAMTTIGSSNKQRRIRFTVCLAFAVITAFFDFLFITPLAVELSL